MITSDIASYCHKENARGRRVRQKQMSAGEEPGTEACVGLPAGPGEEEQSAQVSCVSGMDMKMYVTL